MLSRRPFATELIKFRLAGDYSQRLLTLREIEPPEDARRTSSKRISSIGSIIARALIHSLGSRKLINTKLGRQ